MKKCISCDREMIDRALFCPRCGVAQPELNPTAKKWRMIAFLSIGITCLSVFMPMIVIVGPGVYGFDMIDFSTLLGISVLLICGVAFYEAWHNNYAVITVVSNGFFVFFWIAIYRYIKFMENIPKTTMGGLIAMTGFSISPDTGSMIFLLGSVAMGVAGILCRASMGNRGNLIKLWYEQTVQSVRVLKVGMPGIVWTGAVIMILVFFAMQSQFYKNWKMLEP